MDRKSEILLGWHRGLPVIGDGSGKVNVVVLTMCVLAISAGCLAQSQTQRRAVAARGGIGTVDSVDQAIERLSRFVGAPSEDGSTVGDRLGAMETVPLDDPMIMIDVLRPTVILPATGEVTFEPVDRSVFGRTLLMAGSTVTLCDGAVVTAGSAVDPGSCVASGLVVNSGTTSVQLTGSKATAELNPGEGFLAACEPSCSVTCRDGYYACGTGANGCARCGCLKDGTLAVCPAGGPGSASCSITARDEDLVPFVPTDQGERR